MIKHITMHRFQIDRNVPLVYPPRFCMTIFSNFSWVLQLSQEKSIFFLFYFTFIYLFIAIFFFGGGGGGVKQGALWYW